MGIIARQTIKGTIWSYLGVIIGFFTTVYLYPNYLTPEVVGLFGLLLSWSSLFAQFSALGFNSVIYRIFPQFRDKTNKHNGFIFITFFVMLIGFLLFFFTFLLIRPWLIESNIEKSALFAQYVHLIVPLTLLTLLFTILDSFNKMLYNAVLGTFLNEFVQRLLILLILFFYILGWLTPHSLILSYAFIVCLKGVFLFIYLVFNKEICIKPKLSFITPNLKNEIINVAIFGILTGVGGSIIFQIDKIIINQTLGLNATGVYSIAFFFGSLVAIPSRTLLRISGTLISDAFKRNDLKEIESIYKSSCINQFIIAAFLFGGVWINIDNILEILGPDYSDGKWVIFFIGLAYLIDMSTGTNGHLISYSKHYRAALWLTLVLVATMIPLMFIFIPLWGIRGAAAAISFTFLINNSIKFYYAKFRFGMQPFTIKFLYVILSFVLSWLATLLLPQLNLIMDIFLRSTIFTIIYFPVVYVLKTSNEMIKLVDKFFNYYKNQH